MFQKAVSVVGGGGDNGIVSSELVSTNASKSIQIKNGYYSITDNASTNISNGTVVDGVFTKFFQNATYCNVNYDAPTNTLSFTNNYNQVRFSYALF